MALLLFAGRLDAPLTELPEDGGLSIRLLLIPYLSRDVPRVPEWHRDSTPEALADRLEDHHG